jgi:hypothetical protein
MFLITLVVTIVAASGFVAVPPTASRLLSTSSSSSSWSKTRLYQERRQPWNVFRSFQQSSKFISLPSLPFSSPSSPKTQTIQPGQVVWQPLTPSYTSPGSSSGGTTTTPLLFQWAPLDDVVMGGVSSSTMDNGSGRWKGFVTDANSGGFVGIRSTPNVQLDVSACRGLEFKFQAATTDNNMPRRIKVVVRDSTDFNGIAWTISVDLPPKSNGGFFNSGNAKAQVVSIQVPLQDKSLIPTRFARIVKDEQGKGGLDKTSVTALQLVYSKFEYEGALNPKFQVGDFELRLLEVKAY